jgi:acyl-coenzyme A synthetase/AMP-(fatty) acid ligase
MTNTPEWVVCSFAAMRLGAAVVPINTFLKPAEIRYVIAQSGARHLLMIDSFRKLRPADMLAEICPEFAVAQAPGILFSTEQPELRNVILFGRSGDCHAGAFSVEEVENVIASHEAIAACAAVGVPDERKGEAVRAYVTRRPRHSIERQELHTWLEVRLARFKVPREIIFLDTLPRLANGKLDRVTLNQVACSFQYDRACIMARSVTGTQALMWGADYPHHEGTFPRSREVLAHLFDGIDISEQDKADIVGANAARLFRIPRPD